MPKKESIELKGQEVKDRFGDPLAGPQPTWLRVDGATVVPRSSGDFKQRGEIIIKGFMIVVPSSVAVEDTDGIRVRGEIHEIDGTVGDYGRKKIFYTVAVNV